MTDTEYEVKTTHLLINTGRLSLHTLEFGQELANSFSTE